MKEMSVFDAKTHFSSLVEQVYKQHKSVTITRRGVKIAKVVPFEREREEKIFDIIRALKVLSDEIGHVGITLRNIQKMKEEGRE